MDLSNLKPAKGSRKPRKRVGRGPGSGLGKTSGRGEKGQKSRSGYSGKVGFEGGQMPLHRRVPKRGFTNIFKKQFDIVNVSDLETRFKEGQVVDAESMAAAGLRKANSTKKIRVLGKGDLKTKLTVHADHFSASAKEKIEKAGGTCQEIQ
ncbi:MAG: 50S ribosomal protein L15 [Acidobacteria bacterium]|nr:50S ribosomal protein L15 [Acidobacteriota bacterium]